MEDRTISHNITLDGVKLKDMSLLGRIVAELSNGKAKLDMNAKSFRTYAGQPTNCDAKIAMPGRHDIGLAKNTNGSYTPVFDPYGMDPIFSAGHGRGVEKIGKLLQEYGLRKAEYEAAQRGFTPTRQKASDGTVTLTLTAAS